MTITAATKVYAIIGDPVSQSLSPVMHNGWIADHGLDAAYVALPLKSEEPVAAIRTLSGLAGANVTAPHKEAAARAAGWPEGDVANVLRWESDGSLSAFNTDGVGFIDALEERVPDWRDQISKAVIIGAGGAALAIGRALETSVEQLSFVNRTRTRAEAAVATLTFVKADALPWSELEGAFASADLIVQTTTPGMAGMAPPTWPVEACKPSAIIADIVYRPPQTDLLRAANTRGLTTLDGLGMLIHQGARSFKIWFGIDPDVAKARARLVDALSA